MPPEADTHPSGETSEPPVADPSPAVEPDAVAAYRPPEVGETFEDRFEIVRKIATGATGTVYEARDTRSERTLLLRLLSPAQLASLDAAIFDDVVRRTKSLKARSIATFYGAPRCAGTRYFVSEFVPGQRLSDLVVAKRRAGKPFTANGAYNIVAHALHALQIAHGQDIVHGDLRPGNVRIDAQGRVKITDLGIGLFLAQLRASGGKPSPYDARPDLPPVLSDLRAVALMFAEIVSGLPADEALTGLPPLLQDILRPYIMLTAETPSAADLKDALGEAARQVPSRTPAPDAVHGADGRAPTPLPPAAAVAEAPKRKRLDSEALFRDVLAKVGAPSADEERWLAHKDGLDYGPFSEKELIDRVRNEEFDDDTIVQDLSTGTRQRLIEVHEFEKSLGRLLAERKARAKMDQAAHEARVKTAKKAGKGSLYAGFLGAALVVGLSAWAFLHTPQPKPIDYRDVALSFGSILTQPALGDYEAVAMERFKAEKERKRRAKKRALRKVVDLGGGGGGEPGVTSVDLSDEGGGSGAGPFSQAAADRAVSKAQGSLNKCLQKELKRNPNFRGITLEFWFQPSGRANKARVVGRGTRIMQQCMSGAVGGMRISPFSGFARKVSLPFRISR